MHVRAHTTAGRQLLGRVPALLACSLVAGALVPAALADTIYLTDGEVIEDVTIVSETVERVTYKSRGSESEVPSATVSRVVFEREPRQLEEATVALASGDTATALFVYNDYVKGVLAEEIDPKRYTWAPAYAASRAIEMSTSIGDSARVISAADTLLTNYADSRYVPAAFMAKADAQAALGKEADAIETLGALTALAKERGLSKRWTLESELRATMINANLALEQKLSRLEQLEKDAGDDYPAVIERLKVGLGETLLELADKVPDSRDTYLARARETFEGVLGADPSEPSVLAGIHTGLGDCAYLEAGGELAQLERARMHYLRVSVLYPEESRYVAKSLAFAALISREIGKQNGDEAEKERAAKLATRMLRRFPNSRWASQAQSALR